MFREQEWETAGSSVPSQLLPPNQNLSRNFVSRLVLNGWRVMEADDLALQHDKDVGVYGFIFCRDGEWVDVVIDECVEITILIHYNS